MTWQLTDVLQCVASHRNQERLVVLDLCLLAETSLRIVLTVLSCHNNRHAAPCIFTATHPPKCYCVKISGYNDTDYSWLYLGAVLKTRLLMSCLDFVISIS